MELQGSSQPLNKNDYGNAFYILVAGEDGRVMGVKGKRVRGDGSMMISQ